jgi:HK97 family phage portal protein
MAMLEKLFERRDATLSLTNYKQWVDLGLASGTASGVSVTPEGALAHSAVYACVRILAETMASLPLIMYERLERGKRRAEDHYLYTLLKDQPNEFMTSFEYRETLQGHLALRGNAYSLVDYDGSGRVTSLFPLRPDRMLQIVEGGDRRLFHYMLPSGEMRWFDNLHIWHLRGMGSDGLYGYSPIHLARQAIGLGMAAEKYGALFFSNGAEPGVILQHPSKLSDDAYKRIRKSWDKMHGGLDKKHRMAIVEEGMTVEKIGIPPDDAQFLETRKFQLQEIARIYRIPPHMLADLDRATFSNIEHQAIEFVVHTIRHWCVRWEQSIKACLMLEAERKRFFPEFLVDALLRGDILSRYQAYAAARQNGWFSANDIRELENMNPIEGGDVYLVPLNMVPTEQISLAPVATQKAGSVLPGVGPEARKAEPADRKKAARERLQVAKSYRRVFEDVGERAVKRELHEIKHAAEKLLDKRALPAEFEQWVRDYYRDFPEVLSELWSPTFFAIGEAIQGLAANEVGAPVGMTPGLDECLQYHINRSIARHATLSTNLVLAALAAGDGSADSITEAIADWPERRPPAFAAWETVRTSNLMAKATYFYAGATGLEWIRLDENPFCPSLEGRIIEMGANCRGTHFVMEGEEVPARSKRSGVMKPSWNVSTPPLFEGCDCQIAPVMPDPSGGMPAGRGRWVEEEIELAVLL